MTNKQWLLEQMQNMSDEELADLREMHDFICQKVENCKDFSCSGGICSVCKLDWLKAEHKEIPKLSDAERVILENLPEYYKWIARDEFDNQLFIYTVKPIKNEIKNNWGAEGDNADLELFNHLFQFIKWEDENPYNIEELLKGE